MAEESREQIWPSLDYAAWRETCATLQLWTQIVGKIRLALGPWINHSWGVTLYVASRGLTTSLIPYGMRAFEIEFDFIRHQLCIATSEGAERAIKLQPQSVASFYREVMSKLRELAIEVHIGMKPNETLEAIPFDRDEKHAAYDPEYANRFWRALLQADRVFKEFRSRFCGKCSPVHFFWGSFDLAVTRFSGRPAPPHPGGIPHLPDAITREAYSQEVSSLGFWPGNDQIPTAALLFLRLSFARWFRRCESKAGGGFVSSAVRRIRFALRRRASARNRPTMRFWSLRKPLMTPLPRWQNGTEPPSRRRNRPCNLHRNTCN